VIRKYILAVLLFAISLSVKAQNQEALFEKSLLTLNDMLVNESHSSFKKAVFSVENAYLNGKLDTIAANNQIKVLTNLCQSLIANRFLAYVESDKPDVNKWASVYQVMCDSIPIIIKDEEYKYIPFRYDFDDVFGNQELSSMFVSKLLVTRKGNCHSLPYLYKILCEELGTTANLALAPNHIYIKHQSKKHGWYNTELTSGIFPNDAWLMASGFIHVDAIKNGVYMKALSNKESIALVLMDLANAYQRIFPNNNGRFLLSCAESAVGAYPHLTTALILRAEMHKKQIEKETNTEKAKRDFKELEKEYAHIHELGYRYMPEEMYLNWLISLKTERDKFENKKMTNFNKK
jgi:hypothetical protein